MNMEELLAQESLPDIQERTTVKGKVIQVNRDEAYVDIGYKQEIAIPSWLTRLRSPLRTSSKSAMSSMSMSFPSVATTAASSPR